ncbi:class I histocompatibility antigen, F10 alpha chain-like [Pseudopipra pipra]|uniref:class I histocompatibility antigen, F10 alpha chain-like n=1 Tax=Pseudopipra pipra TaxID=415032 RepID=UPI003139D31B
MAPALGLGALLALLGVSGGQPKVLHSMRYLEVAVTEPSPGIPQFMVLGYVDGIPFERYDSERGWVEPLTPWMAAGAEPGYWDRETQIDRGNQLVAAYKLDVGRDRYNWSGGEWGELENGGCVGLGWDVWGQNVDPRHSNVEDRLEMRGHMNMAKAMDELLKYKTQSD